MTQVFGKVGNYTAAVSTPDEVIATRSVCRNLCLIVDSKIYELHNSG